MKQTIWLAIFFFAYLASGYELSGIKRMDGDKALFLFEGNLNDQLPQWSIDRGVVSIVLPNTQLAPKLTEKIEIDSPHILVKKIAAIPDGQSVKIRLVTNGSIEALKDRIQIVPAEKGYLISVDYPEKNASALKLLQEEQTPFQVATSKDSKESASGLRSISIVVGLFLFFSALLGVVFVRYMKKQGGFKGSRKYLIEQLSYSPIGQKGGVSLLKVGKEFILVGVTGTQINFLSHLPKLQEQYEEESDFERGVFKDSIAEEMQKIRAA